MESCPECGSVNLIDVEIDPDCQACDLIECEDCDAQYERGEMVGVDHTCREATR